MPTLRSKGVLWCWENNHSPVGLEMTWTASDSKTRSPGPPWCSFCRGDPDLPEDSLRARPPAALWGWDIHIVLLLHRDVGTWVDLQQVWSRPCVQPDPEGCALLSTGDPHCTAGSGMPPPVTTVPSVSRAALLSITLLLLLAQK